MSRSRKRTPVWIWGVAAGVVFLGVVAGIAAFTGRDRRAAAPQPTSTNSAKSVQKNAAPDPIATETPPATRSPRLTSSPAASTNPPVVSTLPPKELQAQVIEPPIRLVAGQPLPGQRFIFPHLKIDAGDSRMEIDGSEVTYFAPPGSSPAAPRVDPSAKRGVAKTQGFQIGLAPDRIDYELRPKGRENLELDVTLKDAGIAGATVESYLWKDQPYEILNADLTVIYSHPQVEDLGARREPLPKPEPRDPGSFEEEFGAFK